MLLTTKWWSWVDEFLEASKSGLGVFYGGLELWPRSPGGMIGLVLVSDVLLLSLSLCVFLHSADQHLLSLSICTIISYHCHLL